MLDWEWHSVWDVDRLPFLMLRRADVRCWTGLTRPTAFFHLWPSAYQHSVQLDSTAQQQLYCSAQPYNSARPRNQLLAQLTRTQLEILSPNAMLPSADIGLRGTMTQSATQHQHGSIVYHRSEAPIGRLTPITTSWAISHVSLPVSQRPVSLTSHMRINYPNSKSTEHVFN